MTTERDSVCDARMTPSGESARLGTSADPMDLRAPIIQFWVSAARRHLALPCWLPGHQPIAHRRVLVFHALAAVRLYRNDRQIKQVTYREGEAEFRFEVAAPDT